MVTRPRVPELLVVDGHDGAGKTSIARRLDPVYGRYVRPFGGTLGDFIAWLAYRQRWTDLNEVARAAVEQVVEANRDAQRLIFDRHWLSMFTLLPDGFRSAWYPVPHTVLCWADLSTTLRRLDERDEPAGDVGEHERFIALYRDLAARYRVPVVDTSRLTLDEGVAEVVRLAGLQPLAATMPAGRR